ncbi:prolyl oligopeptidase family serine peptidase [Alysiella filiformis]|uniref:Prolyl oligopeptidase n=1 Tax=Alysiella filiformis DSM 16848 TaxID=1120981 RepID=A0A286EFZ7_9NEIS|nr:prolyl oligopeptidase family serine peptidase [Alysiella filiformis]QMT31239.1 S9 family peptidase [Alysiella filiformis]UBQ55760.1 prolyl oligopeptidase family serine peptidase [Alysiella filiformis DSM 16848]SOD69827.1 prolyl oligopeptidase [Alysiella filiformis DSM 16848]
MSADEFQYLEDLSSAQTQSFYQQAHAKTRAKFTQSDYFHQTKQAIVSQLQDDKQIPFCQEHRAKMYHFHQSADNPKGVYRVCSAASYRAGLPEWEILFSVADFDTILGDDVYLSGVSHYVAQPEMALLTLSAAGSDSAYTIEFNLKNKEIVANGFHFPLGKNHIAWRDENSVWVCPAWDERQLTTSGYPRQAWLMRRGQAFEDATPVLEMDANGVLIHAWRYLDGQGAPIDLIETAHTFYTKDYYYVNADLQAIKLALPKDCELLAYLAGQLIVKLKSDWQRSKQKYLSGSLIALKLNKGELGEAQCLFVPNATQALESIETTKKFIIASLLDNVSGSLKAWKWENGAWVAQNLPTFPKGAIEITDQPWGGDTVHLAASDFVTPLTLFSLDLNVMELTVLRRQPKQFDATNIQFHQYFATSHDGTKIPYYHVGKSQSPNTPTLVYVYGGFAVPELPHYLGAMGRHWLEQGGAFVLANVRGGGEFAHWHTAAIRENKHKSVDDLLGILQDLCERGFTSPQKIAIQGGSNGGLVVASAFCRQPESMGAMVCEVPLTDMLRYTELYAGASWIDEYGDPNDPKMADYLAQFSPYHQLSGSLNYPPSLMTTSLADDRVHPAHALKFYAKLQQNPNAPTWLYAPETGGHTGNGTQEDTAAELATVLAFLRETIIQAA